MILHIREYTFVQGNKKVCLYCYGYIFCCYCLVAKSSPTLFFFFFKVPLFCYPMDYIAHQAPLSMEFPRQEYWSGLPFPSLGDLSDPGIKPATPAWQADSLPLKSHGDIYIYIYIYIYIDIHINICLYTKICNTEGTCITSVFSHTKIKYWWTSECNPLLNPYFKVRMILRCEQIYILMPWFRYFIFNSCFQSTSSQCCHMLIYGNNDLHLKAIS